MSAEEIVVQSAMHDVVEAYMDYRDVFRRFRMMVGLRPTNDAHECVSGVVDKLGRLTRHVKHNGRNDPKDSFPGDAVESFAGAIAYMDLIMESFDISDKEVMDGMMSELKKSVRQHAKDE